MPSPFPGMDPYLEADNLWPEFQHQFVACLHQSLLPGLVDRYRARVGQRNYSTEQALFTSVVRDEHEEEFIEIRQRADGRLVTLVDVVSPANKTSPAGRQAYLAKRKEAKAANANLVEIDLVMQGQSMIDYANESVQDSHHKVTVTRATKTDHEVYCTTIQKKLPKFRLPLAADDRDTVVDLQATFARCFDQCNLLGQINYHLDPPTSLADSDRRWIDETLKQLKLRH